MSLFNRPMQQNAMPQQQPVQPPEQPMLSPQQLGLVGVEDNSLINPCINGLIQIIEGQANRNPARNACYQHAANNQWNNNFFFEAVGDAVRYANLLVAAYGNTPHSAVATAVEDVASIATSELVTRDPQLQQNLTPQAQQGINDNLNKMQNIGNALQQFYQQYQQQPQSQVGMGYGNTQNQFPQQQQTGYAMGGGQPRPPIGAHTRGTSPQQRGNMFDAPNQSQATNAPTRGIRESGMSRRATPKVETMDDVATANDTQRWQQTGQEFDRRRQSYQTTTQHIPAKTPVDEDFNNTPFGDLDTPQPQPQQPKPAENGIVVDEEKGIAIVPAHLSEWEVTSPQHLLYDTRKYVLYHALDKSGVVREMVKEKDEGMDYSQHETNARLNTKIPPLDDGRVVPIDEILPENTQHLPDSLDGVDEDTIADIEASKDTLVLPEVFDVTSGHHAKMLAGFYTIDKDMGKVWDTRPVQFSYNHVYPVMNRDIVMEGDSKIDLKELLTLTLELETVGEYHKQLVKLSKMPNFPRDVLHMLNEQSTAAVNDAMKSGLALDWEIASFISDWEDTCDEFIISFGEEAGVQYRNRMVAKYGRQIIGGGMRVLKGSALDNVFSPEGALSQFNKQRKSMVVLSMFCTETHVRFHSTDIAVDLKAGANALERKFLPNLYDAVDKMVKKAEGAFSDFQQLVIVTSDGVRIGVQQGALGKGHYVLTT